jgi:hypothetical protein
MEVGTRLAPKRLPMSRVIEAGLEIVGAKELATGTEAAAGIARRRAGRE